MLGHFILGFGWCSVAHSSVLCKYGVRATHLSLVQTGKRLRGLELSSQTPLEEKKKKKKKLFQIFCSKSHSCFFLSKNILNETWGVFIWSSTSESNKLKLGLHKIELQTPNKPPALILYFLQQSKMYNCVFFLIYYFNPHMELTKLNPSSVVIVMLWFRLGGRMKHDEVTQPVPLAVWMTCFKAFLSDGSSKS